MYIHLFTFVVLLKINFLIQEFQKSLYLVHFTVTLTSIESAFEDLRSFSNS